MNIRPGFNLVALFCGKIGGSREGRRLFSGDRPDEDGGRGVKAIERK